LQASASLARPTVANANGTGSVARSFRSRVPTATTTNMTMLAPGFANV